MRVMFWLSRAHAPLWWDSNCASNDPLLRHPALPAVFTCQFHEYRKRTKHNVAGFELSTQSKETTSALLRVSRVLFFAGANRRPIDASNPQTRLPAANDSTAVRMAHRLFPRIGTP